MFDGGRELVAGEYFALEGASVGRRRPASVRPRYERPRGQHETTTASSRIDPDHRCPVCNLQGSGPARLERNHGWNRPLAGQEAKAMEFIAGDGLQYLKKHEGTYFERLEMIGRAKGNQTSSDGSGKSAAFRSGTYKPRTNTDAPEHPRSIAQSLMPQAAVNCAGTRFLRRLPARRQRRCRPRLRQARRRLRFRPLCRRRLPDVFGRLLAVGYGAESWTDLGVGDSWRFLRTALGQKPLLCGGFPIADHGGRRKRRRKSSWLSLSPCVRLLC